MLELDCLKEKEREKRKRAALASLFIPGLGQFIRKRIAAGLFFFVFSFLMIWFLTEIWEINYGIIGTITGLFIFYCLNIIDAYKGPAINKAPCTAKCPAGINIPLYISLVREGRFDDALEVIRDRTPFPSVCGRVCYHPCETVCSLRKKGGAIAIEFLKRAASDYGKDEIITSKTSPHNKSIAIIGAGPAGLSAAYFLARRCYPVTVYDSEKKPGGLLTYAIPEFRLPKDLVQKDIEFIRKMGVEIITSKSAGKNIPLSRLLSEHSALVIASGSAKSQNIDIPGNQLKGVYKAIDILKKTNEGNPETLSGKVAVIGGGNSAFDVSRCALRCGAKNVTIYYRRNRQEMPGNIEEMDMAVREGVEIEFQASPLRFIGENRVQQIEFAKTQLLKRESGERSAIKLLEGTSFKVPADFVIVATGQSPDFSFLPEDIKQKIVSNNAIIVNHQTMQTPIQGIFAAGDITDGKKTVIDAIEMGRKVSLGVDKYLRKVGRIGRILGRISDFDFEPQYRLPRKKAAKGNRAEQDLLPEENAVTSFFEVELGLTEEEAQEEASRCEKCNRK